MGQRVEEIGFLLAVVGLVAASGYILPDVILEFEDAVGDVVDLGDVRRVTDDLPQLGEANIPASLDLLHDGPPCVETVESAHALKARPRFAGQACVQEPPGALIFTL